MTSELNLSNGNNSPHYVVGVVEHFDVIRSNPNLKKFLATQCTPSGSLSMPLSA